MTQLVCIAKLYYRFLFLRDIAPPHRLCNLSPISPHGIIFSACDSTSLLSGLTAIQKDALMSKLSGVSVNTPAAAQESEQKGPITRTQATKYLLDVLIVLFMGFLLFWGILPQISVWNSDTAKYQCYAVAFWQGIQAVNSLQPNECLILGSASSTALVQNMQSLGLPTGLIDLVKSQSPAQPFHALPHEYPVLALGPFTLALIVPAHWYQVAFALWMAVVAGIIYTMCIRLAHSM